ncbi:MAG: hypothetical protein JNK75_01540 [Betaproteobacteria bacterium]|nr:hypothetical protein [Betaproteobacteria bacterium]
MKPQRDAPLLTLPGAPSLMQWLKAARDPGAASSARRPGLAARWKSSNRVVIAGRS